MYEILHPEFMFLYEINKLITKCMRYDCWVYEICIVWDMMPHRCDHISFDFWALDIQNQVILKYILDQSVLPPAWINCIFSFLWSTWLSLIDLICRSNPLIFNAFFLAFTLWIWVCVWSPMTRTSWSWSLHSNWTYSMAISLAKTFKLKLITDPFLNLNPWSKSFSYLSW